MKILQIDVVAGSRAGYGASRYVLDLSSTLAEKGQEVHLLKNENRLDLADEEREGIRLHFLDWGIPFTGYHDRLQALLSDLSLGERLVRLWTEHGPFDLVAVHDWAGGLVGAMAARVFGRPLLATFHGTAIGRGAGRLSPDEAYVAEMERWLCERADRIVAPSEFVRHELETLHSVVPAKISVVPGGVRAAPFRADVDWEEFRGMFAAPDEALVLFVGRLSPEKGADAFLDIAAEVVRTRPKTRFVMAGDGPLRESISPRAEELRVRLTGRLGPAVLSALYRVADLHLIPSRYEAFGLSALEAILHGLPVVATDGGALPEIARRCPDVKAVPSDLLAPAAMEILARGAARERDRAPSEERIPQGFRWADAAQEIVRLYESLSVSTST